MALRRCYSIPKIIYITKKISLFKEYLNNFQFIKAGPEFDITIIDDVFPFHISPWRNQEYLEIAQQFKTRVYSDGIEYNKLLPANTTYEEALKKFQSTFPNSKIHPKKLKLFSPINTQLVYVLFYGYLNRYKKHIFKHQLNLSFNLYPGGGFDTQSDLVKKNLKEITQYNGFKDVIVTQNYSRDYILNEIGVPMEQVHLVKSIMMLPDYYSFDPFEKKSWFGIDKDSFDIAFVANKYSPLGEDKGFDVFLKLSQKLKAKYKFVNFHIVGGFTEKDIPEHFDKQDFTCYGFKDFQFFIDFYKTIDVFVSPNKPFTLGGNFDGFPLGTSYEAGICGAVVMMTDYLNENEVYEDQIDYFNINEGVEQIIACCDYLILNPEKMQGMVKNFRSKTFNFSNTNDALSRKIDVLAKSIRASKL